MTTKVYVLSIGSYSDFSVCGVTTDGAVALDWETFNDHSAAEFILDEIKMPDVGHELVLHLDTGEIWGDIVKVPFGGSDISVSRPYSGPARQLRVSIAGDIEHAKRAAFDVRGRLLERYNGNPPSGMYFDDLSLRHEWK